MNSLLVEYEYECPSVSLMNKMLQALAKQYGCCVVLKKGTRITCDDIRRCDTYISIRGYSYLASVLMKKASNMGKRCAVLVDDDLAMLQNGGPLTRHRRIYFLQIIGYSHAVLCVNYALGEKYAHLTKTQRAIYFDSILPIATDKADGADKPITSPVTILYAANATHAVFFETYIAPVLGNISRQARRPVQLVFMGVQPQLGSDAAGIPVSYIPVQPYDQYRAALLAGRFDIGVAPLFPNEFTRMKYYNKFIDYATANIAGIYSDCEPYSVVVKQEYNGLLCTADANAWEKAIVAMVNDEELRRRCVRNAADDVRRLCSVDRNLKILYEGLSSLKTEQQSVARTLPLPCARLIGAMISAGEKVEKSLRFARQNGISSVAHKITTHIQARKAFKGNKKQ